MPELLSLPAGFLVCLCISQSVSPAVLTFPDCLQTWLNGKPGERLGLVKHSFTMHHIQSELLCSPGPRVVLTEADSLYIPDFYQGEECSAAEVHVLIHTPRNMEATKHEGCML